MISDKIVFFDGACGLCNRVVDLLIWIDKAKTLRFASLQSHYAKQFFAEKKVSLSAFDTIYFYHNQHLYHKSAAVKQILLNLGRMWRFLGKLIGLIPLVITDYIYDVAAKNRFTIFGKTTCRIPTTQERDRFLT